ncbi:MAG: hypothetical protein OEZ42_16370, partial [Gemmatimonadota bacterium]|nr:hypothetical protein [Gemmatimonadota bacterium]
ALGCVAYWLLTGRLVFEADAPMKMMIAHIRDTPFPASQLSEFAISRSLDELILACLEKDPARRPQTAGELAERVAACDVGEPWTPAMAIAWWMAHLPDLTGPGREPPMAAEDD